MAFTLKNWSLEKVGVVGSGQIGPDIALFFTKVLAPFGVPVVVVDVSQDALNAGKAKLEKKVAKGVETGAFKADEAQRMTGNITWTTDYSAFKGCRLVVEAATENPGIKQKIVAALEAVVEPDCIIASNSSHLEPEVIFEKAKAPEHGLVVHYFFPAERNIIVEVVPGKATHDVVTDWVMDFYEQIGKAPILVGSRYGYAIDPVFEGLFLAAALQVESGAGSVKQVDEIARKALGLGIGPFTAMNLTGGNPITAVGLDHYTAKIHKWFRTPASLKAKVEKKEPWETAGKGEKIEYTEEQFRKIADAMTGAYFGLVGEIVDSGISNVGDMNMAVSTALVVKPPFEWMNEIGTGNALKLVEQYAASNPGFPVPKCIKERAGKPFEIPMVFRRDVNGVAVIKIRRPAVLNALNLEVFRQLRAHCEAVEGDAGIKGAVITGFGTKAFVSGADIDMLAALKTAAEGEANSRQFHVTLDYIEDMRKPVICAYNGLALGGGNELAMACHARIARKGLKLLAGQPEVNLGIIPGAGGTQRLPRWIGFDRALQMMRTAKPIDGKTGLELGLIVEEVEGDPVPRAVELVNEYAGGKRELKRIAREALTGLPGKAPDLDIGHLSKRIDQILCDTVINGCKLPLRDGLKLESKAFGECVETEDMHIGMETFLKEGARAKAAFKHK
ncbi:MAG: 3-hydroxyacyl-CoA dehydrogenase/enoyl-CoA hydratase family protein [Planctomycetes bacterium]|nr:3-hydroxyacyl-CoA dehydrogenase/enoyl-CoA hydratase family protein [Planctomycetota bacterium]MCW8136564.1 3-hydroxyacyl-CoA dehydrogenase/enoyl-CoA hydratase family protein [Planctomycetota bacterium]